MRIGRYVLGIVAGFTIMEMAVAGLYCSIPKGNTNQAHCDAILVLGYPSNPDGSPSPEQRERVLEAVREYRAGVAPRLILTGGPAHNRIVEAHTMGDLARAQGVPPEAIYEEGQARNTIENAGYSQRILAAHNWHSIEIISSAGHLPRASLIFLHLASSYPPQSYPLAWYTHAAPWPREYNPLRVAGAYLLEANYTARLRCLGFRPHRFLH